MSEAGIQQEQSLPLPQDPLPSPDQYPNLTGHARYLADLERQIQDSITAKFHQAPLYLKENAAKSRIAEANDYTLDFLKDFD